MEINFQIPEIPNTSILGILIHVSKIRHSTVSPGEKKSRKSVFCNTVSTSIIHSLKPW